MKNYLNSRAFIISSLILIIFSIVCTRIPLLNYLGFEFSVFTVIVAGFLCGILTLSFFKVNVLERKSDVWKFIGEVYLTQIVLLIIPFLLSLANALFVKNCSIGDGLILYGLTVLPGVFFASSLAVIIGVVFEKWNKTIFTIIFILILLHIPIVGLLKPQIFAFNLIVGFSPGFTYDETLEVTRRLLIFRFQTLAVTILIITAAVWIWQFKFTKKKSDQVSMPIIETALIALLLPLILVGILFNERLGFSSSENFIRQKLAGNYRTEHFEIIYPAGSVKRERIEQIGRLHEFYFDELNKELNLSKVEIIKTFIYSSSEQKGKLIGAANTDIAKPWLRQIHINISDLEPGLKHEMVHILAVNFGWSPLRIGRNTGLTEGLAMALEGSSTIGSSLHQTAALIFAANLNPNVASLFSFGGFVRENSSLSYNIAGSFCRYLIDTRGMNLFKKLYESGEFENEYNITLEDLVNEWKASLKTISLTQGDIFKAQYLFRRPSIFGKECARVLANINSEARDLLNRREFEKALALANQSLSLIKTPEAITRKIGALFELRRFEEVVEFAEIQMKDSSINFLLLPLRLRLGDAYWALDSLAQAKRNYEILEATHLNDWYDEICALRLEAIRDDKLEEMVKPFFIYSMEDTTRIVRLEQLQNPLARFLLAREYAGKERYTESINEFNQIESRVSSKLDYFRLKHLGIAYYYLEDFKKAKECFSNAMVLAPTGTSELITREWIHRCEFEQRK